MQSTCHSCAIQPLEIERLGTRMSIEKMTDVWKYSQFGGPKLLLLLAIADMADDDGYCWPSIIHLAFKIRRSERSTQKMMAQILRARPKELVIAKAGGVGARWNQTNRYKVVIQAHDHGFRRKLADLYAARQGRGEEIDTPSAEEVGGEEIDTRRVRKSSPGGEEIDTARGEEILTQIIIEPSNNHHSLTTTTTAAAAVDVGNGDWNWNALSSATKLPKKSAEQLAASPSRPAAFVALYLYGLSATGIKTPKLWASRQLIENPAAGAGEPYDSLAQIGPARLAALCGWMRDGGPLPDLGDFAGAALAWRGAMNRKHQGGEPLATAADQALNELGLSGLVALPAPLDLERAAATPPAALDVWQSMLANGLSQEMNASTLSRLRRCHLVADNGPDGIVVGVPAAHDYDWLSRKMGDQLSRLHRVTLVPVYA